MFYLVFSKNSKSKIRFLEQSMSDETKLEYISESCADAARFLKDTVIMRMISKIGASNVSSNRHYYMLELESGVVVCDRPADSIASLHEAGVENKEYSETDFCIGLAEEYSETTDDSTKQLIAELNQRIQEINNTRESAADDVDVNSERFRRFAANKTAYIAMKNDGVPLPDPSFQSWSVEQLQKMTLAEYEVTSKNVNIFGGSSSSHASLFM